MLCLLFWHATWNNTTFLLWIVYVLQHTHITSCSFTPVWVLALQSRGHSSWPHNVRSTVGCVLWQVLERWYVYSSVVSFLFTLVTTNASGTQSSVLYRAVACYVLTIPDLSRTRERELMWYTMAQAFPMTLPPCSGPWFKFISEQRCRGIHDYGDRYRFGSGLSAIVDPTTTTSNSGVQVSTTVVITSRSRTLWCGYWKGLLQPTWIILPFPSSIHAAEALCLSRRESCKMLRLFLQA